MSIYEKAKEWLKEPPPDNGEPEPEGIAPAREIILGLLNENDELSQDVCSECSGHYGWIENRVEGKAVCGCIQEAEPFQILEEALARIQQAATGEIQIADDDTEGMKWIANEALKALQLVLPLEYGKSV